MPDNRQTKFKAHGQTKAEIENAGNAALTAALERAEAQAGIQAGTRRLDGKLIMITVMFYPTVKFFLQEIFASDPQAYGPHREMTREDYARTEGWL